MSGRRQGPDPRSRRIALLVALGLVFAVAGGAAYQGLAHLRSQAVEVTAGQAADVPYERTDGLHYTVVDEKGEIILQTGLFVTAGDEYVTAGNLHYRIVTVEGDRACAVLLGEFSLETPDEQGTAGEPGAVSAAAAPKTTVVGIYHTHGDESYVKGDGTSTIRGKGGIFDVGSALVTATQRKGLTVNYASGATHIPHDSGAYRRSRRTATGLLRGGAATLLDVHRDTAPQATYEATVGGQTVSKVMLVVGRANPQMQTTLNFARNYKKVLDAEYPGISRGIYFGRGSYNQDLSPRAILLEIGSHRTPKEHAIRTAELIGAALPKILGVAGSVGGGGSRASWVNLGWILLVVAAGAGGYLVVASGGWKQALEKLGGFVRREFASALAPRRGTRDGYPRDREPARPSARPRSGAAAARHKTGEKDGQGKEQGTG